MGKRICSVADCDRTVLARDYCRTHYERWRVHGDPQAHIPIGPHRGPGLCAVEDCGRFGKLIRGWCSKHYTRWKNHGDPLHTDVILGDSEARFWSKVDKNGADGCWLWTAKPDHKGYGRFSHEGRNVFAHRYSYESLVGPIPEGLVIDHLCRTPLCVNPSHLEPVTLRENLMRGVGAPAQNARKTHCKHGHEFTPENTRPAAGGGRRCRECDRERDRQAYRMTHGGDVS